MPAGARLKLPRDLLFLTHLQRPRPLHASKIEDFRAVSWAVRGHGFAWTAPELRNIPVPKGKD